MAFWIVLAFICETENIKFYPEIEKQNERFRFVGFI